MDTYTESERLQGKPRNYSTVLSAFSGIGGLDLGVRAAIPTRTICYIEREITCAKILAQRASEGFWGLDDAPIYSDVKSFPTELFAGKVDILIGGFPCQPFSVAGKQEGSEDERNLWPDTLRLIRSLRPRYAFLENVPGLVSHPYFGTILGDLAQAGYDAEWLCLTASEIGASHRRERVFILAHANSSGSGEDLQQAELWSTGTEQSPCDCGGTESEEDEQVTRGREGNINRPELPEFPPGPGDPRWEWIIEHYPELAPSRCKLYETEPEVRNVDDAWEIKDRVAALMMLGNAVVPQQAEHAFRTLLARIEP